MQKRRGDQRNNGKAKAQLVELIPLTLNMKYTFGGMVFKKFRSLLLQERNDASIKLARMKCIRYEKIIYSNIRSMTFNFVHVCT